jgi:hypothetical protein
MKTFKTWQAAFTYIRERNKADTVTIQGPDTIGAETWRLYPSGNAELVKIEPVRKSAKTALTK